MQQRSLLTLTLTLLSSACFLSPANAQEPLRPDVMIDRSVLSDLKGYEPPPMFGATRSKPVATPPLNRVPVAPPTAATLTVPNADALLDFPVKNTDVVTRQRMTAPEDALTHARPDYSDSHTVLDMTPKVTKPLVVAEDKKADAPKKVAASAKPPKPPKKPIAQLASVKAEETVKAAPVAKAVVEFPKKDEKVIIKAEKVAPQPSAATVMIPAKPVEKYVPKTKPTMPVVKFDPVEKNKLDAFALPLDDNDKVLTGVVPKPTPGERMIDQALTNHMTPIDKKDIEATVAGGKVAQGKKTEPLAMAALPNSNKSGGAKIEQVSMEFKPKLTELQTDQQSTLTSEVLPQLLRHTDSRLQIQAFASEPGSDSDARRISLSRALSVRAYLLTKGIEPSRMDVRAMGNNTKETPADRVDLVLIRQN